MATSTGTITTSAGPLDVATLVSKLMDSERTMLNPLTKQASSYNTLISAYGSLKNALSTYQSALNDLTAASFSSQKASVSNTGTGAMLTTDPFTANVNSTDSTTALTQIIQSAGFPDSQTFNAGDTLAIKVGTNSPRFITLQENATLAGVRDAINAAKADVTASITTDDSGDHLVLESNAAGTANTIKVQANNSLSSLAYDPANPTSGTVTQIQAPRDATAAASGNYTVAISQLAQAQKITSAGFASDATFNSGLLAIKTSKGSTAIINPTTNTLAGVRDAINTSSAGVNATIISNGPAAYLVIAAKDSGADNLIRVTGTGDYSSLAFDPSGQYTSPSVTPDQTFDTGGLVLNVGGITTSIALGDTSQTLADVRDAINTANAGVTADITNDGTNDHLVLTPSGTGATSPVSLSGTGDFSILSGSIMGQLQTAQDAKLSIDGISITSATNKIANAISGVTLNLSKVTTAADNVMLNITNDTSGVISAANTFVSAYNALLKTITGLTQQTPSTIPGQPGSSSPLANESAVQNIMAQLRIALVRSVPGGNGISTLTDIGIGFQKDGTLGLDATKLSTATTNNFAGITSLFLSDSAPNTMGANGILKNLQTLVNKFLADGGIIDIKTKGLQASLKINADRQMALQMRLENLQDQYTRQFNALNATLVNMTATQNYLTQQLAKLPKVD
ncbi:MAG: flagellar filament capping protein FliD [Herbaspirillum sp.]